MDGAVGDVRSAGDRHGRSPGGLGQAIGRAGVMRRQDHQVRHVGSADDDVGLAQHAQAPDVVLVEVGQDRRADVARHVAEAVQSGAESLVRADLESGQPVVKHLGEPARE